MDWCPKCGGTMDGDGFTQAITCEYFSPHPDLCPEPDSGPWYCDTDGITDPEVYKTFEDCWSCGRMVDPKELIDHNITRDGKEINRRVCTDCNNHRSFAIMDKL